MLAQVEAFLRKSRIAPSRFGRDCIGDSRLVGDLRNGRELRPVTADKVKAFMRDWKP